MSVGTFRITFDASIPLDEAQDTLELSVIAAEALHGQSEVRLEAEYKMDFPTRTCLIHATSDAGRDLLQIFVGYLSEEFGEKAFAVRRIEALPVESSGSARR